MKTEVKRYSWYALGLLTLVYVFNYLDRTIIYILLPLIKKEMAFSRFVLLHDHNYIPQPSMFWRRSLYEAVKGLDPQFDLAMDADLWERFAARTRIAHMPRYLSCMRFYPEQKTRSRKAEGRREDGAIRERAALFASRAYTAAAFRIMARCLRVSAKAVAGGYTARVPKEQRAWLEQYASDGARK